MEISTNKSIVASIVAFIIGLSCCWLPALIILFGGATGALGFANQLEGYSGIFLTIGGALLAYGGYRYWKAKQTADSNATETDVILKSELTCPHCSHAKIEIMPTNACQFFYECENCKTILKPKKGDCCVYCSYGTVPCPPIQQNVSCCSLSLVIVCLTFGHGKESRSHTANRFYKRDAIYSANDLVRVG